MNSLYASMIGDLETIKNNNTNLEDCLLLASMSNNYEIVKYLSKLVKNENALTYACGYGYFNIVKILIKDNININALNQAVLYNHNEIVKYLIKHNVNITDEAMNNAIIIGNDNMFKYLIKHGGDINFKNCYAIKHYSLNGNIKMVKFLIDNNATIDNKSLYYAVCGYYVDVAKLLIKNGAIVEKYMLEYLHYYEQVTIVEKFKWDGECYDKLTNLLLKYLKNDI